MFTSILRKCYNVFAEVKMKKFILMLLLTIGTLGLFIGNINAIEKPEITDHEKVKIYVFRSNSCGHCHNLLDFFSDKAVEYKDYFEIISYEVGGNATNSAFKSVVNKKLEISETGVPLIVIGDKHRIGFGSSSGNEIIEDALKAYQDEDYVDAVAQIIEEEEIEHEPETFMEACESIGIKCIDDPNQKNYDILIVIGIFVVIIGGFAALMITSNKKS